MQRERFQGGEILGYGKAILESRGAKRLRTRHVSLSGRFTCCSNIYNCLFPILQKIDLRNCRSGVKDINVRDFRDTDLLSCFGNTLRFSKRLKITSIQSKTKSLIMPHASLRVLMCTVRFESANGPLTIKLLGLRWKNHGSGRFFTKRRVQGFLEIPQSPPPCGFPGGLHHKLDRSS